MIEINNGIIKTVRSLAQKKFRDQEGLFVAEGTKCVRDTWNAFNCRWLIATRTWYDQFGTAAHYPHLVIASKKQMSQMSQFNTPSDVMAVYEIPHRQFSAKDIEGNLNLVLDNIQDPGNLGTIIRLADWFGIRNIFASKTTVDVFNHKVVQATMGAIARVRVHYCDLVALLNEYASEQMPVCGTLLDGENIYTKDLPQSAFVAFGNEGKGIGKELRELVNERLLIPCAPQGTGSESLNVGVAAAITISEFMRNKLK